MIKISKRGTKLMFCTHKDPRKGRKATAGAVCKKKEARHFEMLNMVLMIMLG